LQQAIDMNNRSEQIHQRFTLFFGQATDIQYLYIISTFVCLWVRQETNPFKSCSLEHRDCHLPEKSLQRPITNLANIQRLFNTHCICHVDQQLNAY